MKMKEEYSGCFGGVCVCEREGKERIFLQRKENARTLYSSTQPACRVELAFGNLVSGCQCVCGGRRGNRQQEKHIELKKDVK